VHASASPLVTPQAQAQQLERGGHQANGAGFEVKRTNNFGFVFKERKGIKAKVVSLF
jgi:hypothetical protein